MDKNYSIILQSKIPSFISDDPAYSNFVSFFETYYTWFNDTYNVTGFGNKIDIDYNYNDFLSYFKEDFLPYFPEVFATDTTKLIKIVRELYKSKGIPDSFKFLFRALYNSYCEITPTRDFIFKPSDGKWIVPKSIKIKSTDARFLDIANYKIFGVQSKTVGIVESSKYSGNRIQIYLSNIERLYFSGETIQILDGNNKEVYFLNGVPVVYDTTPPTGSVALSTKIIGALSSININSEYRGQYYKVGDPVSIVGGLNPEIAFPIGASAKVLEVTLGQILDVSITNGGFGFNKFPDTSIDVIYNNAVDSVANCIVSLVDESQPTITSVFAVDSISNNFLIALNSNNFNFAANANINSTLKNTLAFNIITTYPITDVIVNNGGGGYENAPTLNFSSHINSYDLKDFGILSPIRIVNGGHSYAANDKIQISGGSGNFAFSKINSVDANGSIVSVSYYTSNTNLYTLGGMGYSNLHLPSITVTSNTGSNAVLSVPGILGTGVEYNLETDKIGAITKIRLDNYGEDYSSVPTVSLTVQDIKITNVLTTQTENTIVYQGTNVLFPTFSATVDSFFNISHSIIPSEDVYTVRVFNYKGTLDVNLPLNLYNTTASTIVSVYTILDTKVYGDGSAKATAKFLNGLIIGDGTYLNTDGQASAFSILQSDIYNNSTYFLSSEKDYDTYKDVVYGLIHPTGSRLFSRNLLRSNTNLNLVTNSKVFITSTNTSVVFSAVAPITNGSMFANTFIYSPNNVHPYPTDLYSWITTGSACTLTRDTISSPVGNKPLKMAITGNDPYTASYNNSIYNLSPAAAGQTWTASIWVKASVATNCQLFILSANSSNVFIGAANGNYSITTDWQRISYTYTLTDALTAFVQVRLDGTNTSGSGITIWWDGLTVWEGTDYANNIQYFVNNVSNNINLSIETSNNMNVFSTITSVNTQNSLITLKDFVQYKFPNVYSGTISNNEITITSENYPEPRYNVSSLLTINDNLIIGNTINRVIGISNNIISCANSFANTISNGIFTVSKSLTSNLISTQISK